MTQDSHPPEDYVRERVAAADRQRRTRDVGRRVWRVAPFGAAAAVGVALAGRLAGWSPLVAVIILVLAGAAIAALAALGRRTHDISDGEAAAIDEQAALNGELRSAHWFARNASGPSDPWVSWHLHRAADRLRGVDWSAVYPAPGAQRAKAATLLLTVAALAIALVFPGRAIISASRPADKKATAPTEADLLKKIDDLLDAAESGRGRELTMVELQGLLAKLDEMRAKGGTAPQKNDGTKKGEVPTEADLKALAERAKKAAGDPSLQPEVRDALADMAKKLKDAAAQKAENKEPRDANDEEQQPGSDLAKANSSNGEKAAGGQQQQSVKEASGSASVGLMMMSNDGSGGKEASAAVSGAADLPDGRGNRPDIAAALRKETIESAVDNEGEKKETTERRQTEQGTATSRFSGAAAAAQGRGRSAAPPQVPDTRRSALRSYFIRKQ